MALGAWVEAMRLRTLPVSVAGVLAGAGCAVMTGTARVLPAVICFLFAVLAQIASNFANEYFDYRAGLDRPGRQGPRRGVTEGDISPRAMLVATFALLAAACAVGLWLVAWGGWWLVAVGAVIAVGVTAYSAGPYPLSHHGLGEVAVVLFFGLIPVTFTCYLASGQWTVNALLASIAIGLMGANVLIVNNYRDHDDDAAGGKRTLAVLVGAHRMPGLYLAFGVVAVAVMLPVWIRISAWTTVVPALYLCVHLRLWTMLRRRSGSSLNPMLGMTAVTMAVYALLFLAAALILG